MRGAIAAGHPLTAQAGARVLEEGGNAVDACIAAGFASWVAESPLTGPGGGGFMLVHRARDGANRLLDFFVAIPGSGLGEHERADMESVDIDFDASSSQVFHIGAPSCAVPGTPAGLEAAHKMYGSRPWRELVALAVELARAGVELSRPQAYLHAILDVILRHTSESRAIYELEGERLVAGDRLAMPELADTLELVAERGVGELYTGEIGRAIVRHVQAGGGDLTEEDLAEYRVVWRRPVEASFRDHDFLSNPPPSSGGVLIAFGLGLLDRTGLGGPPGSAEAMGALIEAMREQTRARDSAFTSSLYRGGLAARLLSERALTAAAARVRTGTTHISVVDARGNAASLSASTGAGSGVVVPGTGIHVNNMLGEYDLIAGSARPGRRLTSMMAPSVVLQDGRPRLVVGSAGSIRLRGAILQTVVNVVGHGLGVEEAIERPRVHLEERQVHCEGGADQDELDRLEGLGYEVVRWRRRNLFFGGVSAVEMLEGGGLAAAGDPRRGGAGVVVNA